MYYVLDFAHHAFVSCDSDTDAQTAIHNLVNEGHRLEDLMVVTTLETDVCTAEDFLAEMDESSALTMFLVTDIQWDAEKDADLPNSLVVFAETEDDIEDVLTVEFGYCVFSYGREEMVEQDDVRCYCAECSHGEPGGMFDENIFFFADHKPTMEEVEEYLREDLVQSILHVCSVEESENDAMREDDPSEEIPCCYPILSASGKNESPVEKNHEPEESGSPVRPFYVTNIKWNNDGDNLPKSLLVFAADEEDIVKILFNVGGCPAAGATVKPAPFEEAFDWLYSSGVIPDAFPVFGV